MPPRNRTAPPEGTRVLPQTADELANLIRERVPSNIILTGMTMQPTQLAGNIRAALQTAQQAIQFSFSRGNGENDPPLDYQLLTRGPDFNRMAQAIRQQGQRSRFR